MATKEITDKIYPALADTSGSFVFSDEQRKKYASLYQETSIPNRRQEDWKYIDLKEVFEATYSEAQKARTTKELEDFIKTHSMSTDKIVFVNGVYSQELSHLPNKGIDVKEIGKTDLSVLNSTHLNEENKLTILNTLFAKNGICISISNTEAEGPLELLYINTSSDKTIGQTRNIVIAEKNSSSKIMEQHLSIGISNVFTNIANEIIVEENAQIEWNILVNISNSDIQITNTKVVQGSNSTFTMNNIQINGGTIRNSIIVNQDSEYCRTNLNGIFASKAEQHFDNFTQVCHNKPNCTTNEVYKGLASDSSTGVFVGKIYVAPNAQKTLANQSNKNMVLSKTANIHSKPQLEIFADDVSCSHGSTTGQINKEALFYMQQRGIPKDKAVKLMLGAFFSDVMNLLTLENFKSRVSKLLEDSIV